MEDAGTIGHRDRRPHSTATFLLRLAGDVARAAVEAVYPKKCCACGSCWSTEAHRQLDAKQACHAETPDQRLAGLFRRVMRPYLCPECIASFEPVASPVCSRCGIMFASRFGADHICGTCIQHPLAIRRARSAGIYAGGLMGVVHQLKYRARLGLADPLSRLLQEVFDQHWSVEEIDLVLAVPLHGKRLRQRGFNQAQMLTDAWAKRQGRPLEGCMGFAKPRHVLVRNKSTPPLTGLGKPARRRSIRGAFAVIDGKDLKGQRILLVDDVFTTGATANEAARELKRSGAAWVDVITVARTMPRL